MGIASRVARWSRTSSMTWVSGLMPVPHRPAHTRSTVLMPGRAGVVLPMVVVPGSWSACSRSSTVSTAASGEHDT